MDELKNKGPNIRELNKDQPFRVPDHYFADFSVRIQSRIQAEKESHVHGGRTVIRYLKPILGMAASFALIFMLVYWPLRSFLPGYLAQSENSAIEQETEMETYMPSIEKIDENSFFEIVYEILTVPEDAEGELNDEELLTYLTTNVSDYELYLQTEN